MIDRVKTRYSVAICEAQRRQSHTAVRLAALVAFALAIPGCSDHSGANETAQSADAARNWQQVVDQPDDNVTTTPSLAAHVERTPEMASSTGPKSRLQEYENLAMPAARQIATARIMESCGYVPAMWAREFERQAMLAGLADRHMSDLREGLTDAELATATSYLEEQEREARAYATADGASGCDRVGSSETRQLIGQAYLANREAASASGIH